MKPPRFVVTGLIASLCLPASALCGGNAVLYWNDQAIDAARLSRQPPPLVSFVLATCHVAIFDAVNGVTGTHEGWLVNETAPRGADMDAVVAGASFTVLNTLWGQAVNPRHFQVAYENALAAIPDGGAKTDGLAWGVYVARQVLAERATSGFDKPEPGIYSSTEPGRWRETPPGFRPPVLPHWRKMRPFAMTSPAQFRAPPPPALDSAEYAEELAFVARVGARDGSERSEDETLCGPFWSDDLGTATPPGHWNVIAQDIVRRRGLSTPDTARLFALLNIAAADAAISCWETKFHYRTWRPETGLRETDPAINARFQPRPDFIPNMVSPAFPSYTSGHSTFSAAASRVLERFFGTDEIGFTTTSDGLPGAVRTFKRLSEAREEVGMSRVWAGIHTMSDNLAGQQAGLAIADWVFDRKLRPRRITAATP